MLNIALLKNWQNWLVVGSAAFMGVIGYALVQGYKPGSNNQ